MQQGPLPFSNGSVGSRGDKGGVFLSAGGRSRVADKIEIHHDTRHTRHFSQPSTEEGPNDDS